MKSNATSPVKRWAPVRALAVALLLGVTPTLGSAADQVANSSGVSASTTTSEGVSEKKPDASSLKTEPKSVKKAPASAEKGVIAKVREWVEDKWRRFRSGTSAAPSPVNAGNSRKAQPRGVPAGVPSRMLGQGLAAPSASKASESSARNPTSSESSSPTISNLPRTESGVPVYSIGNVDLIPRLDIGEEEKISAGRYSLGGDAANFFDRMVAHQKDSPPLLTAKQVADLKKIPPAAGPVAKVKTVFFKPKGKVSREAFDKIVLVRTPENKFDLQKYVALTPQELRFLSGLLLFQQGDKCPVAIGLFHSLAKTPSYAAEGNYYLAMCSKKLGLMTDFIDRARRVIESGDVHYSKKILPEVSPDIPYEFIEPFGKALLKASANKQIMALDSPAVVGNVHFILANYAAQTENFKLASQYGRLVPETHAKWPHAQFLLALGEYQTGQKDKAVEIQKQLIAKLDSDKTKAEFQGLVALNLARMLFQEQKFKESREWFLKVYKDHPLWLQSLQEMGWSQLQSGDFEGAIGNMYSVQSPYFNSVYKPESYVVRTIGYLNLCQYGDAYRTLTILEKTYRPWLVGMTNYQKGQPDYLGTIRRFLALKSASAEIDSLPSQVIREMVRHKDYLNLQTSLNRQVDERGEYAKLDKEVDKSLARARWLVNNSRKRAATLRAQIASIKANPQLEQNRLAWKTELDNELDLLNGYFFEIDLYNEARAALRDYRLEVIAGADKRIEKMRTRIVSVLESRMKRMREDLARMLENNELLRYEVFAGSGENIRFQVAGGEKGNRIPADVTPQSKTLQWDFDGEYWEDEIGHYRSSLKNNCPDTKTAGL